ncbi:hypothetical protein IQ252_09855 [Tychonema sp. LEGE 07203]|nr:hypothetical protein [Tychonema sp. LEGE 07203]
MGNLWGTRLRSEVVGTENDSAVETRFTETFVGPKADWSIENIPNPDLVLDSRTLPVNPQPLATNKKYNQQNRSPTIKNLHYLLL